jgi:hypothetical protein
VPAPNITASIRYFRPGITRFVFCASVANKASPTRAEINAGTDLSNEVGEINGFQVTSAFDDAPDLGSRFAPKIGKRITADDSSLNFYSSSNSVDVRSLLPRDTVGFVLIMDEGDTAGRKMDVFPVVVAAAPKQRGMEDTAMIQVQFAITSQPSENVTIPA